MIRLMADASPLLAKTYVSFFEAFITDNSLVQVGFVAISVATCGKLKELVIRNLVLFDFASITLSD